MRRKRNPNILCNLATTELFLDGFMRVCTHPEVGSNTKNSTGVFLFCFFLYISAISHMLGIFLFSKNTHDTCISFTEHTFFGDKRIPVLIHIAEFHTDFGAEAVCIPRQKPHGICGPLHLIGIHAAVYTAQIFPDLKIRRTKQNL